MKVINTEKCDFRPESNRVPFRHRRAPEGPRNRLYGENRGAGKRFMVEVGPPCGAKAVFIYREDGNTVCRCMKHRGL